MGWSTNRVHGLNCDLFGRANIFDLDRGELASNLVTARWQIRKPLCPNGSCSIKSIPSSGQEFIAMANVQIDKSAVQLVAPKTDVEFELALYSALRAADRQGLAVDVNHQPTGQGIAIAIRDLLMRAFYKL